MSGLRDDVMLKAATGLEGGVVAHGSTCGVVTGGALGLGLLFSEHVNRGGIKARAQVVELAGRYVDYFQDNYGTARCRERTGVNFHTPSGQLRYFLPGDKMAPCFRHIYGAAHYLNAVCNNDPGLSIEAEKTDNPAPGCASKVLEIVRQKTGIGHDAVIAASCVLDGGVGLSGGICGAISGAVMGLNLVLGVDVRSLGFFQTLKPFIAGHANLLRNKPIGGGPETFFEGKRLVEQVGEQAGGLDCRDIIAKRFSGWDDFQGHMSGSDACMDLIRFAGNRASEAVSRVING